MSDFIITQLLCPNCGHREFAVVNTGYLVCEKCRKGSVLKGRYGPNDKEKILEMQINDKTLRSDDKNRTYSIPRA